MLEKRKIMAVTLTGSLANFLLLVFKFVAGVLGHSSAMIADAVHSLSDFVTDVIVLLFINISSKPKDEGHDYGHGKYETLATTIIGIVLMCVGAGPFAGMVRTRYLDFILEANSWKVPARSHLLPPLSLF